MSSVALSHQMSAARSLWATVVDAPALGTQHEQAGLPRDWHRDLVIVGKAAPARSQEVGEIVKASEVSRWRQQLGTSRQILKGEDGVCSDASRKGQEQTRT